MHEPVLDVDEKEARRARVPYRALAEIGHRVKHAFHAL